MKLLIMNKQIIKIKTFKQNNFIQIQITTSQPAIKQSPSRPLRVPGVVLMTFVNETGIQSLLFSVCLFIQMQTISIWFKFRIIQMLSSSSDGVKCVYRADGQLKDQREHSFLASETRGSTFFGTSSPHGRPSSSLATEQNWKN